MEPIHNQPPIPFNYSQGLAKFIFDHSRAIKITQIALDALAIGAIIAGYALVSFATTPILELVIGGVILLGLVETIYYALNTLGYLAVSKSDRPFTERTYGESKLYYQGEIPILEIKANNHRDAGYAHGYLAGEGIFFMMTNLFFMIRFGSMLVTANIEKITKVIPKDYLEELKGIVAGVNARKRETLLGKILPNLTLNQLIFLHLTSSHTDLGVKPTKTIPAAACSSIIDTDPETHNVVIGRNLDWTSCFGTFGKTSLVKKQQIGDGPKLTDITFAGFAGTLTGVNHDTGVFVCQNVSYYSRSDDEQRTKISPCFFNRYVLENSVSADDAARIIQNKEVSPSSAYHMTVADKKAGFSFHPYQNGTYANSLTRFSKKENPIVTLNAEYNTEGISGKNFFHQERSHNIVAHWKKRATDRVKQMKRILGSPFVNNSTTMHSIVFTNGELQMTIPSNSFASSNAWVTV